ncbi:hypothetical protein D6827_02860, partial [Candidatus Parcubacteria bacterium]
MKSCPYPSGLEKAYVSSVVLDERDGKMVVIKRIDKRAREIERLFHNTLRARKLPAMTAVIKKEELWLDYISNAKTLGENLTKHMVKRVGAAVADMHKISVPAVFIFTDGVDIKFKKWSDFIKETIVYGSERQNKRHGFDKKTTLAIIKQLSAFNFNEPVNPVLLHGDLHSDNILIANDEIYIFDPAYWVIGGDPFYDLALLAINLNDELLSAFIEGYGYD